MNPATPEQFIRVLIVDDHPIVRAGLVTLLRKEEALKLVGAARNSEEALRLLKETEVDVVLLDLRLPQVSGLELLCLIQKQDAPPKVIILSSYELEEEIYRAVQAGARGFLSKNAFRQEIVSAIRTVNSGERYFTPNIAATIAERESRSGLSPRELEILEVVAKGLTNKEIARLLRISQYTVRNHINHINSKLEVCDRTEAATVALQQGIIGPHS